MMRSPPKHRHDGTSPLPLGMDWSPPPRIWNGQDTTWPHDPHTGWSYCITIPSWVVRPKSRDSDPVVFYRVQVGIQSPEGVTTTRGVLRRFNDFLKLATVLKRIFPKKSLPPAPPKGLLRIKTRTLLEERRRSLEEWMTTLLSDIDLSRSTPVASFLELEAAARSSFLDENQKAAESNILESGNASPLQVPALSSLSVFAGSTSLASDNGSDTAYETSEIGTSSVGMDDNSEIGTDELSVDEDMTSPIDKLVKYGLSNIDEGLFMGHAILEQLEGLPKHKLQSREINGVTRHNNSENGNVSKGAYLADKKLELFSEAKQSPVVDHVRKLSTESAGSDVSSLKDSVLTNIPFQTPFVDHPGTSEISMADEGRRNTEVQTREAQLVLPLDQRHKLNMVLTTMQRRLITAKTDMEELISRLNQEITVKDYLATKVKDLEVELETNTQKSKENLQQAILLERERVTQMQWAMEGLRRKSLEMELKLKSKQVEKVDTESSTSAKEESSVQQELDETKKQLEDLLKKHQELQIKSKSDIKVLSKEVKSLRISQAELKKELIQSQKQKSEAEKFLHLEEQCRQQANTTRQKLLHECQILQKQLRECSTNYLNEIGEKLIVDSSFLSEARSLLTTSENQIDLLLSEVQLLGQGEGSIVSSNPDEKMDDEMRAQNELRNILKDLFLDNATLRKQVNVVLLSALEVDYSHKKDDEGDHSSKSIER